MLIHDDIFSWKGWGGKLSLGSGKCRLRIYDLKDRKAEGLTLLKPIIVLVSDVPDSKMPVRSAVSHVATLVVEEFSLKPHRMLWVEYYPESRYGKDGARLIPEKFDIVEFAWHQGKAMHPTWRELTPPLLDEIKKLIL